MFVFMPLAGRKGTAALYPLGARLGGWEEGRGPGRLGRSLLSGCMYEIGRTEAEMARSADVARALIPRSVTAALGLPIADALGAPLPIAAAAIVCTGINDAIADAAMSLLKYAWSATCKKEVDVLLAERRTNCTASFVLR